jgi:hypothetical protein
MGDRTCYECHRKGIRNNGESTPAEEKAVPDDMESMGE